MKFFVCFLPEIGKIEKITNEQDDAMFNLEIDKETYINFMQGKTDFNEYTITFNPNTFKKYELVKKEKLSNYNYINKSIRPLEKTSKVDQLNIFCIIQKNKKWKARANLSKEYASFLSNTSKFFDQTKRFYVTEEGNPSKYLGFFDIDMSKFLEKNEFTVADIDINISKKRLSVFTNVINEKYIHIVKEQNEKKI